MQTKNNFYVLNSSKSGNLTKGVALYEIDFDIDKIDKLRNEYYELCGELEPVEDIQNNLEKVKNYQAIFLDEGNANVKCYKRIDFIEVCYGLILEEKLYKKGLVEKSDTRVLENSFWLNNALTYSDLSAEDKEFRKQFNESITVKMLNSNVMDKYLHDRQIYMGKLLKTDYANDFRDFYRTPNGLLQKHLDSSLPTLTALKKVTQGERVVRAAMKKI